MSVTLSVSATRERFSDVVEQARITRQPIYLTRHGRPVAAIIDAAQLDQLLDAAADLEDIQAADAARIEMAAGQPAVPWDDVKKELGLL